MALPYTRPHTHTHTSTCTHTRAPPDIPVPRTVIDRRPPPPTVLLLRGSVAHAHTARRPPPPFTTYRKNVTAGYTTARSCRVVSCRPTAARVGPITAAADRSHRTPPRDRARMSVRHTLSMTIARNVVWKKISTSL